MKTLQNITFLLFICLVGFSATAQEVKLSGKVLHKEENLKDAEIKVISRDSTYEITNSNMWGNFKVKLPAGKIYEIEVSKDKYVTKTILLTAITGSKKNASFEFDVELLKEKEFRYVSVPSKDEPVAHIFYDKEDEELDWDRNVTQKAKEKIEELKQENKEKRYEKYSRF